MASTVKGFDTRAIAYAAIARAYTTANDTASAQTARQTAVKWASSLPTDDNLGVTAKYTLSLISQQFLDANQVEAAWKTLQEISPYGYKDINISNLVSTALALGNLPIAQQAIDLQYSNGTPESFLDQAPQLAKAYLDRNRSEEALKILDLAANLLNNQNNKYPTYVMPIVQLYAKAGRIDAARQVIAKLPNPIPTNDASWRQELQQYVNCHQKTYS